MQLSEELIRDLRDDGLLRPGRPGFRAQACPSGLVCYRGVGVQPPPWRVAGLLGPDVPLHFIVDFRKVKLPVPEATGDPGFVCDWFPRAIAEVCSPVLLGSTRVDDPSALIEAGWGLDGLVALYAAAPEAELLAHLQHYVRAPLDDAPAAAAEVPATGSDGARTPAPSINGLCWPSALGALLENGPRDFVSALMKGIVAVLIEASDAPWALYAGPELATVLARGGLREVPDDAA